MLTRSASPQFVRPITVRVIREIADRYPYDGWTWIDAYELNGKGEAVRRRELYLLRAGLKRPFPPPRVRRGTRSRTPA